jgi:hypothetical protein
MKNISTTWFAGLTVLVLLTPSCVPSYIPNTVNTPLFNGKHQVTGNIGTGISGYDPQVAFSVTDHLGIMINSSFANRDNDTTDNFHKHAFVEGGVGYFYNPTPKFVLECYGGYGIGKVESYYENSWWTGRADAQIQRLFLQPAIGFTTKVFDVSFAPRLVLVDVDISDKDIVNPAPGTDFKTGFRPYIEPTITLKTGYKYAKFFMQFGFSDPFDSNDKYLYESQPFMFSIGMQATFGKKY